MKKIILIIIGILFVKIAISQTSDIELISSSGDSFNNSTYQLDWSIGECITATFITSNFIITQGFHQNSYQILMIDDFRVDIEMKVYPNPTTNFVSLEVDSSKIGNMQYILTSIDGKVLQIKKVAEDKEQINFSNYAIGTYFITVLKGNKLIKSFKIIKN